MRPAGGVLEPWILFQQVLQATYLLRAGVHEVCSQLLLVPVPLVPGLAPLKLAIWRLALLLMVLALGVD